MTGRVRILALGFMLACIGSMARAADIAPVDLLRERLALMAKTPLSESQTYLELADFSKKLSLVLQDPVFGELTGKEQHDTLYAAAVVAFKLGDYPESQRLAGKVCGMPEATSKDWELRFQVAMTLSDRPETKTSVVTLARRYPETLRQMEPGSVDRAITLVLSEKSEDVVAFLMPLFDGQYRVYGALEPSARWSALALELQKRGDLAGAQSVAARITAPETLITLSSELSREPLLAKNPLRLDPRGALAMELAKARELWRLHPRNAIVLRVLLHDLNLAGHFQETIDISGDVIQRARSPGSTAPKFTKDYALNWVFDDRSAAFAGLGQWDDAVRAMEEGSHESEADSFNVSQVLNLAMLNCRLGRSEGINKALQGTRRVSMFGKAVFLAAEHCAALLDGKEGSAGKLLSELREIRDRAPTVHTGALVRSGDLESAAVALIESLENEKTRTFVLWNSQEIESGEASTDLGRVWNERSVALYAREDVKSAIAKYGYQRHYDLRL